MKYAFRYLVSVSDLIKTKLGASLKFKPSKIDFKNANLNAAENESI